MIKDFEGFYHTGNYKCGSNEEYVEVKRIADYINTFILKIVADVINIIGCI